MRFSIARGTASRTTSMVSRARSQAWRPVPAPVLSARASESSWFTVWVARTLARPICLSDCLSSSALAPSRCARSACMRRPASGVLSWCAASARKRFCVWIESLSLSSSSLTDDTSGTTSSGTDDSSSGLRSPGRRSRMRASTTDSGLMPRTSASQISSTASGRIANCGSSTPLMISVASTDCFSRVSATCSSAGSASLSGPASQSEATRTDLPRISPLRSVTTPGTGGSSELGCGTSGSPLSSAPWLSSTW